VRESSRLCLLLWSWLIDVKSSNSLKLFYLPWNSWKGSENEVIAMDPNLFWNVEMWIWVFRQIVTAAMIFNMIKWLKIIQFAQR
jgi:hypothetical protein